MLIKSFAKINLSLQIKGVRPDGYHELEMVNLPLSLHDVIEIDVSPRYANTYIVCDDCFDEHEIQLMHEGGRRYARTLWVQRQLHDPYS